MFLFIAGIIVAICLVVLIGHIRQIYLRNSIIKRIPCPPIVPLWGNLLYFHTTAEDIFFDILRLARDYGKIFQIWVGFFKQVVVTLDPDIMEKVIATSKHIDKSEFYDYLVPWLGYGLLTSTGKKWHKRRRILTPAFHFKILEQSAETFNNASNILINNLKPHVDGAEFDIYPYIRLCTLDIICETAMGIKINAQEQSDSEYVKAVKAICDCVFFRITSFVQQSNFIFRYFTANGRRFYQSLNILHNMTNEVIKKRREALAENIIMINNTPVGDNKKYYTFLDALLQSTVDGKLLKDSDIREEVDTFMFEGHDTVSASLSFTLYLLANHPEVQDKVFREIREIFGDNKKKNATIADLNNMKYLELVIKESLRLYPSVPGIGRKLTEDLPIDNVKIRKGTEIGLFIYGMHHHPDYFPDPESFRPERFLEDSNRSHFVYIPFSAGPRNCIGQKFAMLEMKSTLSKFIRHYELLPADREKDLKLVVTLILKSANGVHIKIRPRVYD